MMLLMDKKKAKKKALLKKNRHNQMIFEALRLREQETERVEDLKEGLKPKRQQQEDDEVWSAKVGEIRNRLTGRKREAMERWNRFAGTGDEGGRGL